MHTEILERMRAELMRRKYSLRTVKVYLFYAEQFLDKYCPDGRSVRKLKKSEIMQFLEKKSSENKAGSTLNLALASVKFLVLEILHRKMNLNVKYSRRPKHLPVFLTKSEVSRLIDAAKNLKHKLIASMLYSAGLRVSELLNLRVCDIEFEQDYGWVRDGKGAKDRYFPLAEKVKPLLTDYIRKKGLDYHDLLFRGRNGHLTARTIQEIIKSLAKAAGIKKHVHPHTLRHSFATHLIEDGYTVNEVQALLGHNCVRTTMTYLHMAKPVINHVRSPLDTLNAENTAIYCTH